MVWRITTDELLARYKAGERNFAGIELIRIVGEMGERDGISGLITGLEGADLGQVNASSASFIDATMSYFLYAVLIYANFRGATDTGERSLCSRFNLICHTTMPDGTVYKGPECKWK